MDPIQIQTDEWASQNISEWLYDGYFRNRYRVKPKFKPVFKEQAEALSARAASRQLEKSFRVEVLDQPIVISGRSRSVQTGGRCAAFD